MAATLLEREAQADLERLLEVIRTERGPAVAQRAAEAVQDAVCEGRIDGLSYVLDASVYGRVGCVLAHLGGVTGTTISGMPDVPGWDGSSSLPMEHWVLDVVPGQVRYRREVQGRQGWDKRKQPDYQPNDKQRQYQQAYYQRKKAAPQQQQPATEAAEKD